MRILFEKSSSSYIFNACMRSSAQALFMHPMRHRILADNIVYAPFFSSQNGTEDNLRNFRVVSSQPCLEVLNSISYLMYIVIINSCIYHSPIDPDLSQKFRIKKAWRPLPQEAHQIDRSSRKIRNPVYGSYNTSFTKLDQFYMELIQKINHRREVDVLPSIINCYV